MALIFLCRLHCSFARKNLVSLISEIFQQKAPEQQVEPGLWGRRGNKDVVVSESVFLLS